MTKTKIEMKKVLALCIGVLFLIFSNGRWLFALAAWLYPIFMLYYTRRSKPLTGYLIISVTAAICCQISFWKFSSFNPSDLLFYLPALLGFMLGLPFLIDRLLYRRFTGILSTLVFPLAYTSMDFLYANLSPLGSMGVLGYSQYEFISLIQIVSITGIWGLTFLVTWFGSVVNKVLENKSDIMKIRRTIFIYCFVMVSVLLYGNFRLLIPSIEDTVKVSGIHVYDKRGTEGAELKKALVDDWEKYRQMCSSIEDRLFDATIREAQAGSKIIVWSELSPPVVKQDEEEFINRAEMIAAQEEIYLVVSPYVKSDNPNVKDENKLLIFDPAGQIVLTHYKFGGNLLEGSVEGDQIIRYANTPYGKISGEICWDQDFPSINRQVGIQNIDILAAPATDWKEIDPIHSVLGYFRAIENGCSLIRESMNGLSIICDSKGRILSAMDHYSSSDWEMSAQVPVKGVFTIYSVIGDLFGWLSLISLLTFAGYQTFCFKIRKQSKGNLSNSIS